MTRYPKKRRDRTKGANGGWNAFIRFPRIKSASVRRDVMLAERLRLLLQRACPNCPEELASGIAVDLTDIWSIGERHKKHIRDLLKLSLPREEDRLYEILAGGVEVDLLFENDYHLRSLRKLLPQFWKNLGSRSRKKKAKPKELEAMRTTAGASK
jgi:hypothetical protein